MHAAVGLDVQPAAATLLAARVLTLLAALLASFGVIMWIAANWGWWDRPAHFGLLGGLLLLSSMGSWILCRFRSTSTALGVVAWAGVGGVLAYFGQAYQTGADPWQLFALWAGLSLPLCLGLRSRVLWMPWSLVANTAISLWAWGELDHAAARYAVPRLLFTVSAFAVSLLVSMALHPALRRTTGSDGLSHRVAMLWTVFLVGTLSLGQFFTLGGKGVALLPGLVLLAAMMHWYGKSRHFDVLVLSAASLAGLVLLFAFVAERLISVTGLDMTGMLLLGVCAMLSLAGAVAWIMRRYRSAEGSATGAGAAVAPVAGTRDPDLALAPALDLGVAQGWWQSRALALSILASDEARERPWAVVLLTALGAWLAVIPFVGALYLFADGSGSTAFGLGAILLVSAVLVLFRQPLPLFAEQLAYAVLVTGLVFLSLGADSVWGAREALWLLFAVLLLLVVALRAPWLELLLGGALCSMTPVVISSLLRRDTDFWLLDQPWTLAWVPATVALAWPLAMLRSSPRWLGVPLVQHATRREGFWAGWMLMVLVGQAASAGMTFLLAGLLDSGGATTTTWGDGVLTSATGLQFWQWWLPLSSGLFAAAAYAIAARRWPLLHQPALGILAVLLVVAAWFLPSLGIPLCFLATATVTRRWRLALASAAATAWVVGAIYYQTNYLLVHKALSLLGLALLIGVLAAWLQRSLASKHAPLSSDGLHAQHTLATPATPPADRLRRQAVLLAPLGVAAVLIPDILRNEALIRDGERLLVKLAPVDPRSLLQGDYMALAFDLGPATVTGEMDEGLNAARYVIFRRAPNGLASAQRLEFDEQRPALAADERRIPLSRKGGRTVLVTDGWHFREGTGARWARAAYGEFRLRKDGRALLVGLADEHLQSIPKD